MGEERKRGKEEKMDGKKEGREGRKKKGKKEGGREERRERKKEGGGRKGRRKGGHNSNHPFIKDLIATEKCFRANTQNSGKFGPNSICAAAKALEGIIQLHIYPHAFPTSRAFHLSAPTPKTSCTQDWRKLKLPSSPQSSSLWWMWCISHQGKLNVDILISPQLWETGGHFQVKGSRYPSIGLRFSIFVWRREVLPSLEGSLRFSTGKSLRDKKKEL